MVGKVREVALVAAVFLKNALVEMNEIAVPCQECGSIMN